MTEVEQLQAQVKALQEENLALQKLVLKSPPRKSYALRDTMKSGGGFGGATEYEVWLRALEWPQLQHLIRLHNGAIDSLRFRRRFIQHEAERRSLHSSYGALPMECLFDPKAGMP